MTTAHHDKSLGEQAYDRLRTMIVQLDLAPGDVLREEDLRAELGIGRTPIREALQRLAREHFVQVIPRRGMFVTAVDVAEFSTLLETRFVLEPYAARLAAARGTEHHWSAMEAELARTDADLAPRELLDLDRRCHEITWEAADNRFIADTLDVLYAQSDRLWHLYLSDVADMDHAVEQHRVLLDALRVGDGAQVAAHMEQHIQSFDDQIRRAVTAHLASPLAGG